MLFPTPEKCFWAMLSGCFSLPPKNISRWFSLDAFFTPRTKHLGDSDSLAVDIGSLQLVWLPQFSCVTICFLKTLQKASDPCGGDMKTIICNAKQCAHTFRLATFELWVAHCGRRVSQRHGLTDLHPTHVKELINKFPWFWSSMPFSTYGSFGCFFLLREKASTPSTLGEIHVGPLRCGFALGTRRCVLRVATGLSLLSEASCQF